MAEAQGSLRRFVLEHHPVRGFWARLDEPWTELLQLRSYPGAVQSLLGEALTASVLLAATLKFEGTLSLQLEGQGPLRLLLAQCTHDFRVRAVADAIITAYDNLQVSDIFQALNPDRSVP